MKHSYLLCAVSMVCSLHLSAQFLPAEIIRPTDPNYNDANPAIADFNADGLKDIAFTQNGDIIVYNGFGSTFGSPQVFDTNLNFANFGSFSAADMDGDGDADLACSSGWVENVNGAFTIGHSFTSLLLNGNVAEFADLNGDGAADVVINGINNSGAYQYQPVSMLNNGIGQFSTEQLQVLYPTAINTATLVDLTGDGHRDIVTDSYGQLLAFQNDGTGHFLPADTLTGPSYYFYEYADLNADGLADVYYPAGINFNVKFNQGGLVFSAPTTVAMSMSISYWDGIFTPNAFDYDADGDVDVLLQSANHSHNWMKNNGDGTFSNGGVVEQFNTGGASGVLWNDFNADDRMDLVRTSPGISITLQDSNGKQMPYDIISGSLPNLTGGANNFSERLMPIDDDGDGDWDFASAIPMGMGIYRNLGNGNFSDIEFAVKGQQLNLIDRMDINNDGLLDLIFTSQLRTLAYSLQTVSGSFSEVISLLSNSNNAYAVSDVNLDGRKDVLVLSQDLNKKLSWYELSTSGSLGTEHILGTWSTATAFAGIEQISEGDFNGDGFNDYAFCTGQIVRIFHGNGSGAYTEVSPTRPVVTGESLLGLSGQMQDMNGDNIDDFVYRSVRTAGSYIGYFTYASGMYTHHTQATALSESFRGSFINDFDMDGDADILFSTANGITNLANDGLGNLSPSFTTTLGLSSPSIWSFTLADLDNDGMQDIAASVNTDPASTYGLNYFIALNNSDSPYQVRCHVFIDENGNGIKDPTENGIAQRQIHFSNNWGYAYSDNNGDYTLYALPGTIDASINQDLSTWIASTPWNQTIILDGANMSQDVYFGMQPNGTIARVEGHINTIEGICGTLSNQWLTITNTGNTIASGSFTFELDPLYTFVSSDVEPTLVNGHTYQWTFENLYYGEHIDINLDVISPDFTHLGDGGHHTLTTLVTDIYGAVLNTDTDSHFFAVECAYDPNEKVELTGWSDEGFVLPNGRLEYSIHFQNTGNAAATNVRINDQISALLDITTLQPIAASHPFVTTINEQGMLTFAFNNILLPDSASDFLGSQGFVTFQIALLPELSAGTVIHNSASIYFDNNPPVVTGATTNTIFDCTQVGIDAPELMCQESLLTFSSDRTDFQNYHWSVDGIMSQQSSAQFNTILSPGTHTIELTCLNPICEVSHSTQAEVIALPVITDFIATSQICSQDTLAIFAISESPITWYLGDLAVSTEQSIVPFTPGLYIAIAQNQCGVVSTQTAVTLGQTPQFASMTTFASTCDQPAALNALPVDELTVNWYFNNQLVGTGNDYIATESGSYTAIIDNGCFSNEAFAEVSIYSPSAIAVTYNDQFVIATSGFEIYSWTIDGVPYPNLSGSEVSTSLGTYYEVVATNSNGCTSTGSVLVESVGDVLAPTWTFYPNPASEFITLKTPASLRGESIRLYDITGKLLQGFGSIKSEITHIDLTNLSNGMYVLMIGDSAQRITKE